MEKLSFMKPVPGAKVIGACCPGWDSLVIPQVDQFWKANELSFGEIRESLIFAFISVPKGKKEASNPRENKNHLKTSFQLLTNSQKEMPSLLLPQSWWVAESSQRKHSVHQMLPGLEQSLWDSLWIPPLIAAKGAGPRSREQRENGEGTGWGSG